MPKASPNSPGTKRSSPSSSKRRRTAHSTQESSWNAPTSPDLILEIVPISYYITPPNLLAPQMPASGLANDPDINFYEPETISSENGQNLRPMYSNPSFATNSSGFFRIPASLATNPNSAPPVVSNTTSQSTLPKELFGSYQLPTTTTIWESEKGMNKSGSKRATHPPYEEIPVVWQDDIVKGHDEQRKWVAISGLYRLDINSCQVPRQAHSLLASLRKYIPENRNEFIQEKEKAFVTVKGYHLFIQSILLKKNVITETDNLAIFLPARSDFAASTTRPGFYTAESKDSSLSSARKKVIAIAQHLTSKGMPLEEMRVHETSDQLCEAFITITLSENAYNSLPIPTPVQSYNNRI